MPTIKPDTPLGSGPRIEPEVDRENDDGPLTSEDSPPLVTDLGAVPTRPGGAIWSLPHGGDLDANLVRLEPGSGIGAHVNNDVDVLVFVQSGGADITIDGLVRRLGTDHVVLIPKGSQRSIAAGASGITYLSIHRRRSPLGISGRTTGRRVGDP